MPKSDQSEPKRRGRPRKAPAEGERKSISFRVTPKVYNFLVEAADTSGYSISEVVERHLEKMADGGGTQTINTELDMTSQSLAFFENQRVAIWSLERNSQSRWRDNESTAVAVYAAMCAILKNNIKIPKDFTLSDPAPDDRVAGLQASWKIGYHFGEILSDPYKRHGIEPAILPIENKITEYFEKNRTDPSD